ncbi:hypothetical protein FOVG_16482 [Fusarium oxysporum f. sp. pisi HDV247]|uniref:CBM-cenC domain-containing protein n=1 Tax=Fusarium oxysporum f. sp. pisi HDV247 TaxID=1080344 RepID=W9NQQ6_FUSOX|nr:hypothetical protein FOVG_16482 [Fusarium oxysporum f. sp. pisi HDV247]
MRVVSTLGSLVIGAGLCAARACAPHPLPTSFSSEVGTTTSESATATSSLTSHETLSATKSETKVESSVTISTSSTEVLSSVGSATTGLEETTSGLTVTETQTTVESAAALETSTTEASTLISSFTTKLATTTYVTSQETETSTAVDEATSTTIGATTTTAEPPVQTANLVQNGGFEDSSIEPWEASGATPTVEALFCPEGTHCLRFTGSYDGNTATICQRVQVEQGFEYTFKANVNQNCIKSFGSAILSCDDKVNTVELLIDGVFDSGDQGIIGDSNYHELSNTFSYVGPSIDSTDLCIIFKVNQGVYYSHYLDGISLTRGKAVPIPAETD